MLPVLSLIPAEIMTQPGSEKAAPPETGTVFSSDFFSIVSFFHSFELTNASLSAAGAFFIQNMK